MKQAQSTGSRHKIKNSKDDKMMNKAIIEFTRLESALLRLRSISEQNRDRTTISDIEKRAKMEGYMQAFSYAADLVGKARKKYSKDLN